MIISPWAMLITPITPKVMERPMAARSRILPSDRPSNRATKILTIPSRKPIEEIALLAAAFTLSSFSDSTSCLSMPRTFGSFESASSATAAKRLAGSGSVRSKRAMTSSIAALVLASVSFSSALRNSAAPSGVGWPAMAVTALRRAPASALNRPSWPSTPWIVPRRRLLADTSVNASLFTSGASLPVCASR